MCFTFFGPESLPPSHRRHSDNKKRTKIDQTLDERVSDGHGEKLISALVGWD